MAGWLRAGTSIQRRYVVQGPLARGGVCEIYQVVDLAHGRPSAIKLLAPAFADSPRARQMMRREAAITRLVRHPSVPRVYDVGEAPLPDGTVVPYLVLELLSGVALTGRLAGGALPWPDAVAVAATVADVLAVAHRRGVVHRDLNPGNIMLTPGGVKIIDFGLAGTAGGAEPADDVYALGVLLYQMLTGASPYPRVSPAAALAARAPGLAPTPVLLVPGLPRMVADLCRACMAKRPAQRPDSAALALALWSVLAGPGRPRPAMPGWPPATAAPALPVRPCPARSGRPQPRGAHGAGQDRGQPPLPVLVDDPTQVVA